MTLNRQTLAKIDKQVLSQMGHGEGVQLVKVPVSEAVWSTWRRYFAMRSGFRWVGPWRHQGMGLSWFRSGPGDKP